MHLSHFVEQKPKTSERHFSFRVTLGINGGGETWQSGFRYYPKSGDVKPPKVKQYGQWKPTIGLDGEFLERLQRMLKDRFKEGKTQEVKGLTAQAVIEALARAAKQNFYPGTPATRRQLFNFDKDTELHKLIAVIAYLREHPDWSIQPWAEYEKILSGDSATAEKEKEK